MRLLVRLYPKAWQERYGEELQALLDERPPGPSAVLDLLLGAFDAHIHRHDFETVGTSQKGVAMSIRRIHPGLLLLMGITALVAGYALIASLIALLAPDPDRWAGWGSVGLATASLLILIGLAVAGWPPRAGLVLGVLGAALAAVAAPWLLLPAVLVGMVPALPYVSDRLHSRRPPAAA